MTLPEDGQSSQEDQGAGQLGMAIAFWVYLGFIVAGLVYFSVIGLTHH